MKKLSIVLVMLLMGCVGIPENVKPVDNFNLEKYLGKWYEIARLDHSFERGLTRVTADYSLRDDGGLRVLDRGYSAKENKWEKAEGKAYFVKNSDQGYLKVSFFGPFYGSYIVFELDHENYEYSLKQDPPTVYGKVTQVSRSGMMRYIDFYVAENGNINNINGLIGAATIYKNTAKGVKVEGCGMDMIFAVIYELSKALYNGDGYKIKNRAM